MNDDHRDVLSAAAKVATSWGAVAWSWLTLNHLGGVLAIVYTALQITVLWREKLARQKDEKP